MKYIWRFKRLFLRKDLRELIDRYKDDQEYLSPEFMDKVSRKTLNDAKAKNLIVLKSGKIGSDSLTTISLTTNKGLPLSRAKFKPNWEKIAALVGITTLISTLAIFGYQTYFANSVKSATYDFTFSSTNIPKTDLETADCWEGITGRSDEFRCTKDNNIHTPCFSDFQVKNIVGCPDNPYDKVYKYFKIKDVRVKSNIDYESNSLRPWFIKLNDGNNCKLVAGATYVIANKRLDYICKNENTVLFLPIEKTNDTIYVGCFKNNRIEKCQTIEVWY